MISYIPFRDPAVSIIQLYEIGNVFEGTFCKSDIKYSYEPVWCAKGINVVIIINNNKLVYIGVR